MDFDVATQHDLEQLRQSKLRALSNPHTAGRTGNGALLGHTIGYAAPTVGDAVIRGVAAVHNAADDLDMAAGRGLHRLGVPPSWTATEEKIDMGRLPYGKAGISPVKSIYTHRASAPVSRAAAIASLAALGLWAKEKLVPSDRPDNMRTASTMSLTNYTDVGNVDSRKLAAHVIDKQANLISELHSTATKMAGYAAALAQAVKLAQDGLIDVSDIQDNARQLYQDGAVKLSAADAVFAQSPGDVLESQDGTDERQDGKQGKLDPLSTFLRSAK